MALVDTGSSRGHMHHSTPAEASASACVCYAMLSARLTQRASAGLLNNGYWTLNNAPTHVRNLRCLKGRSAERSVAVRCQ